MSFSFDIEVIRQEFEKEWHGTQISLFAEYDKDLNRYKANPVSMLAFKSSTLTLEKLNLAFAYFIQGWKAKGRN